MGSWVSKQGIWKPAKERAIIPDAPPGKEVYEGPDRDAMATLKQEGVTHLGQHFKHDPEMIMRARQLGFKDVDEYLSMYNYSKEEADEAYEKATSEIVDHKDPKRVTPVNPPSGGQDTSGMGQSMKGGYTEPPKRI